MTQIEIHNFGPIRDAKIDIKPMLVLIGPQASGKSTVAKLIYFFETLPEELFAEYAYNEESNISIDYLAEFIKKKFINFFGIQKNFDVKCTICNLKWIRISEANNQLTIELHPQFLDYNNDGAALKKLKSTILKMDSTDVERQIILSQIKHKTMHLFGNKHDDNLYAVAGRSSTVSYSQTFSDLFKQSLYQRMSMPISVETSDETLLYSFLKRVSLMKDILNKFHDFESVFPYAEPTIKPLLELANDLIVQVLHGKYTIDYDVERIVHSNGAVRLNVASSGQQEAIRILQDAFLGIYQGNNLFRIVEEPEAHLFPEAQKATIELLTLALNNKNDNNLIITTHSPYTLTVINNLIYAAKVGKDKPEKVKEIVPEALWLPTERVAAYFLKDGAAASIIDDELGEIDPKLIDLVSREINKKYGQITDIEYEEQEEE